MGIDPAASAALEASADLEVSEIGQVASAGRVASAASVDPDAPPDPAGHESLDPGRLAIWSEFHRQVEALPDEEQAVFDLLWYQGLSQAAAAAVLGVNERTVKRRWQSARVKLHDALEGEAPL